MMRAETTSAVERLSQEDALSNQYLQISRNLFMFIPTGPCPVDIHVLKERVNSMSRIHERGARVTKKLRQELDQACGEQSMFIHLNDYKDFVAGLGANMDVVLTEDDLEAGMAADIVIQGLALRLDAFYHQAVAATFDDLVKAVGVFCEFLWAYPDKALAFRERLDDGDDPVGHGVRVGILGSILHVLLYKSQVTDLVNPATGYFVHDVGMLPVPVESYRHEKALTPKQRASVMQHPQVGVKSLSRLERKTSINLEVINEIILTHHERKGGLGYPGRVPNPPVFGQICALADSFVAMVSERSFRQGKMTADKALRELTAQKQFNPTLLANLHAFMARREA